MKHSRPRESRTSVVVLSPRAKTALNEIAETLGVEIGEALGRALGTEVYLLRFAGSSGIVYIEKMDGRNRERMMMKAGGKSHEARDYRKVERARGCDVSRLIDTAPLQKRYPQRRQGKAL